MIIIFRKKNKPFFGFKKNLAENQILNQFGVICSNSIKTNNTNLKEHSLKLWAKGNLSDELQYKFNVN